MRTVRWLGVIGSVALLISAACVTVEETGRGDGGLHNQASDSLIVARIGDAALLTWQTSVGNEYTILYSDGRRSAVTWQPLPGASRVRGTGQEMRIEDQLPPGVTRYYRLMIDSPRR